MKEIKTETTEDTVESVKDVNLKKIRRLSFWKGAVSVLVIFLILHFLLPWIPFKPEASKPDSLLTYWKLRQMQSLIRDKFMGELDEQEETNDVFRGMMVALGDPYSTYYTKEEYESLNMKHEGYYVGIGITITTVIEDEIQKMVVVDVTPGSSAADNGVLAGDCILKINGKDTGAMTVSDAVQEIQSGEPEVLMELQRGEEKPFTVTLKLGMVEIRAVSGEILRDHIGYIGISTFNSLTPEQFAACLQEMKEQGIDSLIIDLRGNLGGLLDSVLGVADQILPKGLIVYEEDKYGKRREYTCSGETPLEMPLVVLVDGNSASASELLTGAIQDHGVGTVVGQQTFGKGIVQNTLLLSDGSALKITVSHYYTPNGNDIHGTGITPDIVIELPKEETSETQTEGKDTSAGEKEKKAEEASKADEQPDKDEFLETAIKVLEKG